jgi:hypothetical protein
LSGLVCCTRSERSGSAWFKTGIWKLRGMRKGSEKGRCPLCTEEEDALYIKLKCSEKILSKKWLTVDEEVAYKSNKLYQCFRVKEYRKILV